MNERDPNELLVSAELLEAMFAKGRGHAYEITEGPDPDARLVGVSFAEGVLRLRYDRPVPETCARTMQAHAVGRAGSRSR